MSDFFANLGSVLETFRVIDVLDILAVAFIFYYAVRLVRETRAMQLVKSIGVIFVVYFAANYLNMVTLKFFLQKLLDVGLIMLVVLFQPELRRALERIGRSRIGFGRIALHQNDQMEQVIDVICKSCEGIVARGDGAIIVIERDIRLGDIALTGTVLDAEMSPELIGNIFVTNSPLHDGAMIIRNGRVYAAGCFLPLSDSVEIDKDMGTRHRAGLGVSEISDAVTVVVSEERRTISVTQDSRLQHGLSPNNLRKVLQNKLLAEPQKTKSFWHFGGGASE